jgi:uncharacterized protein (DUF488 family)
MSEPAAFDLLTVGHSTHPIEDFLELLKGAGVNAIVDVRSVPFSRRFPWFSRDRLAERLRTEGIDYLWLEALGGRPKNPSLYREGVADYEAMAALPDFREALDRVKRAARKSRLCLMCAEREPLDCHRCLLIGRALAGRSMRIGHILADGAIEPHHRTEERLLALSGKSADLFADRKARLAEAYRKRMRAAGTRLKA